MSPASGGAGCHRLLADIGARRSHARGKRRHQCRETLSRIGILRAAAIRERGQVGIGQSRPDRSQEQPADGGARLTWCARCPAAAPRISATGGGFAGSRRRLQQETPPAGGRRSEEVGRVRQVETAVPAQPSRQSTLTVNPRRVVLGGRGAGAIRFSGQTEETARNRFRRPPGTASSVSSSDFSRVRWTPGRATLQTGFRGDGA
jgi:hypothetical protein